MAKRSRRRRSAWGSMAEVSAGVWRIRYWGKDPATGTYRRRSATVRGSRVDAERRRAELMVEHSGDAPCPTVGQVWERWYLPALERRLEEGDLAPNSMKRFRSAWGRHAAPRWADVPCDAIRPLEVQQWLDGMGRSAAESAMTVLRPLLDYAVRFEAVDHNPMRERYIMPSARTVSRQDDGIWSLDQLREVWGAVRGQWFEAAFLLAGFGGLRVGESLGVTAADVTAIEAGGTTLALVSVERQVPNKGTVPAERLKTEQGLRTVPVAGRAGARLLGLAASCDGPLSGDGMGGFGTQQRLQRSWARADLPDGLRHPFRNLRNSWQTWMRWELRVEPHFIEPMMGHKLPGTTGSYYDRPGAQTFAEVMAEAYLARPYDAGWE